MTLIHLLLLLSSACLILLITLHLRFRQLTQRLQGDTPKADQGIHIHPLKNRTSEPLPGLVIHILNPLEVAEQESTFGRVLGKLSPTLITRQVYLKTAETIGHEFRKRRIKARIEVNYRESERLP